MTNTGNFFKISLLTLFLLYSNLSYTASWNTWVNEFKQEAIEYGVEPKLVHTLFKGLKPNPKLLRFEKRQPERRLTFLEYRNSRIDPYRIKLGRQMYKKHYSLLNNVFYEYGVDPSIIVALWGIETSYGRFMGQFNVVRSLATLAYKSRRQKFFRKELLSALKILEGGHVSYNNFVGEWAGASGQPQFLPSSWFNHAQDFDKDGKKDIWKTKGDVFASISNYLINNGWKSNEPILFEVKLSPHYSPRKQELSLKFTKPISYWIEKGVNNTKVFHLDQNMKASLIHPDGGPYFLVLDNFKTLMTYNRSTYYAASVSYLAEQIMKKG